MPQFQFSFESPALFVCRRNKSKLLKYSECQHSNFQWKHGAESCKLQKSSNLPSFYEYSQVNSSQKTKLSFLWKLKILLASGGWWRRRKSFNLLSFSSPVSAAVTFNHCYLLLHESFFIIWFFKTFCNFSKFKIK